MPWKTDDNGAIVVDDSGNPVLVGSDGKEQGIEENYLSKLNTEAAGRRRELNDVREQLKQFEGLDPEKARDALKKLDEVDLSKMVDAGKLDEVRNEVGKAYKQKLEELEDGLNERDSQVRKLLISSAFKGSQYIKDNTVLPPDIAEAYYGKNFEVKDGQAIAKLDGEPIYSQRNPGKLADVDEALEIMVNSSPHKESILKGSGANGTGSNSNGKPSDSGAKTMPRDKFTEMAPAEQMKFVQDGGKLE